MEIYVFQVVTILFCALWLNQNKKVQKRILFFVLLIALSLVMGLRSIQVGTDTYNYMMIYRNISHIDLSKLHVHEIYKWELPFAYLMKFCSIIINDYYFFQVVVSFLYCFGFLRLLFLFSSDFLFSSIIYMSCGLYLGSFNITRQMVVVMLLLWCWYYLLRNKYYKSSLFFLLAIFTHYSAITFGVAVLSYFLVKKWPSLTNIMPMLVISLILYFDLLFPYFSVLFEDQYFNYLNNHKETQTAGGVVYLWGFVITISIISIYFFKKRISPLQRLYGFFALLYVGANIVGLRFNYSERIGLYFAPYVIFLYESFANVFDNKKVATCFKIGVAAFYLVYYLLSTMSDQYVYKSFLS